MNTIKRFESKKRLVKKLKDEAKRYRMATYNRHFFGETEIEKPIGHYIKWAKECEKHARQIEDSYTYKCQKDYAKNRRRKGGR